MTPSSLQKENLFTLWKLALPITLGHLAASANGIIDTLMIGRYSTNDLAAVAMGNGLWMPAFLLLVGIVSATSPLAGFELGRNQRWRAQSVVIQGVWIALTVGALTTAVLLQSHWALGIWEMDPVLRTLTYDYVFWVAFGLPGAAVVTALRSWFECIDLAKLGTYTNVLSLLMNIPLNALFIYGWGPIPAMGAAGCGMATAISMWLGCCFGFWFLKQSASMNDRPMRHWARPQLAGLPRFIRLGLPIGLTIFVEVSAFTLIGLMLARLGAEVVAANQIVINVTSLVFMVPLGCSLANTILVAKHFGAGRLDRAKIAAEVGFANNLAWSLISMTFFISLSDYIAYLFTNDAAVIATAASLFLWAGFVQIVDCWQVMANGVLRGLHDTRVPLQIVCFAFWCVGLPLGWHLTYTFNSGPQGFWVGLALGLTIAAALLSVRLVRKMKALALEH